MVSLFLFQLNSVGLISSGGFTSTHHTPLYHLVKSSPFTVVLSTLMSDVRMTVGALGKVKRYAAGFKVLTKPHRSLKCVHSSGQLQSSLKVGPVSSDSATGDNGDKHGSLHGGGNCTNTAGHTEGKKAVVFLCCAEMLGQWPLWIGYTALQGFKAFCSFLVVEQVKGWKNTVFTIRLWAANLQPEDTNTVIRCSFFFFFFDKPVGSLPKKTMNLV